MRAPLVDGFGRVHTDLRLSLTNNGLLLGRQALPRRGVYAVWVRDAEGTLPGVANIGVRPTFDGATEVLEVHVLGSAAEAELDLYGRVLDVEFVSRIRDERRFDSVEALVAQIGADAVEARTRLDQDAGSLA